MRTLMEIHLSLLCTSTYVRPLSSLETVLSTPAYESEVPDLPRRQFHAGLRHHEPDCDGLVLDRARVALRLPRQSVGAGNFIQQRDRIRYPLSKTTVLRGN